MSVFLRGFSPRFCAGVQLNAPTPPSAGHERRLPAVAGMTKTDTGFPDLRRDRLYRYLPAGRNDKRFTGETLMATGRHNKDNENNVRTYRQGS
jgi:hypothetical protein